MGSAGGNLDRPDLTQPRTTGCLIPSDRSKAHGEWPPMNDTDVVTLWRPTGQAELDLVVASGWRAWPPRLPDQPIFYPVLNEQYATKIARDWNAAREGVGYVTRFRVLRS